LEEKQFEILNNQITKIIKLVSMIVLQSVEKESDKILLLSSIGFEPAEIAKVLSKNRSNVTKTLTVMRKKKGTGS
jgi:precorrin-6B methylase 1